MKVLVNSKFKEVFISYVLIMMSYLMMVIGVLVSVAFMVLMERKVLGYIQLRKGPNKVGYVGLLQSFADAVKLFSKEQTMPLFSSLMVYYFAPSFLFLVVLVMWVVMPTLSNYLSLELGALLFFCVSSVSVYGLLASGWSSNSKYAMLGAMRGVAQMVSYEVSLMMFFMCLVMLIGVYEVFEFFKNQDFCWLVVSLFPVWLIWFSLMLAETNRTPYDFAEGESELVSGFNVEYMSGGFALLFLGEYASIIFMSYLMSIMFFGVGVVNLWMMNFLGVVFCYVTVWVRGTLPRLRYDKLMEMAWKSFLPLSLYYFILCYAVKIMIL